MKEGRSGQVKSDAIGSLVLACEPSRKEGAGRGLMDMTMGERSITSNEGKLDVRFQH